MKALILAAGYATRMYPLTENQPKHLLKVGGKPILEHLLDKLREVKEFKEIMIVTNHCFYDRFRAWLLNFNYPKKIKLIDDGTLREEDRLGSVGDINYILKEEGIDDDLLIISGDNLFDFDLNRFIDFFKKKGKSTVAFCHLDKEKIKGRLGAAKLEGSKVINFEEKPLNPQTTLAATGCYLLKKEDLSKVERLVEQGQADHPGNLISHLVKFSEVQGFVFKEPWFDVGSMESWGEAERFYSQRGKK